MKSQIQGVFKACNKAWQEIKVIITNRTQAISSNSRCYLNKCYLTSNIYHHIHNSSLVKCSQMLDNHHCLIEEVPYLTRWVLVMRGQCLMLRELILLTLKRIKKLLIKHSKSKNRLRAFVSSYKKNRLHMKKSKFQIQLILRSKNTNLSIRIPKQRMTKALRDQRNRRSIRIKVTL